MKMECKACGYIYEEGYNDKDEWTVLQGDKDFIRTDNKIIFNENFDDKIKTIFICPKCGVLKIKL
jgi:rubredoxin